MARVRAEPSRLIKGFTTASSRSSPPASRAARFGPPAGDRPSARARIMAAQVTPISHFPKNSTMVSPPCQRHGGDHGDEQQQGAGPGHPQDQSKGPADLVDEGGHPAARQGGAEGGGHLIGQIVEAQL